MILKGKNIFIVEDDMENRVVFNVILRKHGAVAHFERHGEWATTQLWVLPQIDLIIMDLNLAEGHSGFDVAVQIREYSGGKYAKIPIVAVSATDPSIAIPQAKVHDFAGFIAKPIKYSLFAQQVLDLINGENIWDDGVM